MPKRPRHFPCKRCGELIRMEFRGGFIVKGQPKYRPVNADDGRPHWQRCKLKQELKDALRKEAKKRMDAKHKRTTTHSPQREMFDGSKPEPPGSQGR